MIPLEDATLSKDALGGGRASRGHGDGSSLSFASPFIDWKPICCHDVSYEIFVEEAVLHLSVFPLARLQPAPQAVLAPPDYQRLRLAQRLRS